MKKINYFHPIKMFGLFFLLLGFYSLIMHLIYLSDQNYTIGFLYFNLIVGMMHFIIGVGILLKTSWGFHLFKLYLRLLYLGFPIGTYISIKTLDYIKRYDIEKNFNK